MTAGVSDAEAASFCCSGPRSWPSVRVVACSGMGFWAAGSFPRLYGLPRGFCGRGVGMISMVQRNIA